MASSKYWKSVCEDIRARRKLRALFGHAAIPGSFTVEAYHDDCPMPLAVVWYGFFGLQGIQIQNSFTFEHVRRSGLRTYLHETMLYGYPGHYILSGAGTKSGEAWMKAIGYRRTKAGWEFKRA